MKIKCVACGRRIKAKSNAQRCREYRQRNKQKIREYNERIKEKRKQYYESHKEHYRELNREWYERNKEKRKEYYREYRQRNRKKISEYRQRYMRIYNILYEEIHPFRHTHDKSNDLTIENGRVKGAVWLENQIGKKSVAKNFWRRSPFQRRYEKALCSCSMQTTPFFIAIENNRRYCFECGGKIIIASENEYYTITEVVCSYCGLVLPTS